MKRKTLILGFIGLGLLVGTSYGQGINEFSVKRCDDNNPDYLEKYQEDLILTPGTDQKLCYEIRNTSDEDIDIVIEFVDAGMGNSPKPVCKASDITENFAEYVSKYKKKISLPASESTRYYASLNMPETHAGTQHGCLTIKNQIDVDVIEEAGGLGTIFRRGIPISVYVDEDVEVGLDFDSKKPLSIIQGLSGYNVELGFENTGGLTQEVTINGTVRGPFGYIKELGEKAINITAGGSNVVRYAISDLPWYKMGYTVDLEVVHHAVSKIRSEFITEELLKDHTFNVSGKIFLFPRRLVIVALALLLFLWFLFWITKKGKKNKAHQAELEAQLAEFNAMKAKQEQAEQQQ